MKSDSAQKILTCILHAHVLNAVNPGTYEKELNEMLTQNNLPNIKAPNNPPSSKILNMETPSTTMEHNQTTENPTRENVNKTNEEANSTNKSNEDQTQYNQADMEESEDDSEQETTDKEEEESTPKLTDRDLGLTISTTNNSKLPRKPTTQQILQSFRNNSCKITYTDKEMDIKTLDYLLKGRKIKITKNTEILDDMAYKKLKSGFTPPLRLRSCKNT